MPVFPQCPGWCVCVCARRCVMKEGCSVVESGPCLCLLPLLSLRTSRSSKSLSTDARHGTVLALAGRSESKFDGVVLLWLLFSNEQQR